MENDKQKIKQNVNFSDLRKKSGLTLAQVSEMSGFGISAINGLEKTGKGSKRLKDKLTSVLLSQDEEGAKSETRFWRDRCLIAEKKLESLKGAMQSWVKKI